MANNTGKTIAVLLIGAAAGTAAGYFLGTDKRKRKEHLNTLQDSVRKNFDQAKKKYGEVKGKVKDKLGKEVHDIEENIYNA